MAIGIGTVTESGVQTVTFNFSHNAGTGSDRPLAIACGLNDNDGLVTFDDVQYNSTSLTQLAAAENLYGGGARVTRFEWWTINTPASGSNQVDVTLSGTVDWAFAVAVSLTECSGFSVTVSTATGSGEATLNSTLNIGTSTSLHLGGMGALSERELSTAAPTFLGGYEPTPGDYTMWAGYEDPNATGNNIWGDLVFATTVSRWAIATIEAEEAAGGPAALSISRTKGDLDQWKQGVKIVG